MKAKGITGEEFAFQGDGSRELAAGSAQANLIRSQITWRGRRLPEGWTLLAIRRVVFGQRAIGSLCVAVIKDQSLGFIVNAVCRLYFRATLVALVRSRFYPSLVRVPLSLRFPL